MYKVVLVSGVQQWIIYTYTILFPYKSLQAIE